jgi:dolichyl-phosphate-mannose--protein O-mannosyl transferase
MRASGCFALIYFITGMIQFRTVVAIVIIVVVVVDTVVIHEGMAVQKAMV